MVMPYVVGVVLAVSVALFGRFAGFDRDRAFYPTVLIVVAAYYVLFGVMSDSIPTIVAESGVMLLFVVAAVAGFKRSLWLVAVGLAAHGILDAVHGSLLTNSGVPGWWPAFCGAYDVMAAGCLALILRQQRASERLER
jgi:hypothetical protein